KTQRKKKPNSDPKVHLDIFISSKHFFLTFFEHIQFEQDVPFFTILGLLSHNHFLYIFEKILSLTNGIINRGVWFRFWKVLLVVKNERKFLPWMITSETPDLFWFFRSIIMNDSLEWFLII